ncbi:MAG: carboxypeptidase-like regulatory domain-containing protein [Haliscomenobacter sp.]|nr:carboxypeptidase-like regulatory domain-containing protein [Haliscomenobacter sp.]
MKWAVFTLLFFFGSLHLAAQIKVTGKVIDETPEGLIGVNIMIKNSTEGTVTDLDGNFELMVSDPNATLVFSYTGYANQEILLKGQTQLTVTMREESQMLNEVVVVGYGTQRKATSPARWPA